MSLSMSFPSSTNSGLRVAICGGGFAGLAVAKSLAPMASYLCVFDKEPGPGIGGASAISAGLLHPISAHGKILWKGLEGMAATRSLIRRVEGVMGRSVCILETNAVVKPCWKAEMQDAWESTIRDHPEIVQYIPKEEFCSTYGYHMSAEAKVTLRHGALVKDSALIHSVDYLQGLWRLIQQECESTEWVRSTVSSQATPLDIDRLSKEYDIVVLACGAGIRDYWLHHKLILGEQMSQKMQFIRGQNLLYDVEDGESLPDYALLLGEYVVPYPSRSGPNNKPQFIVGATHEHIKDGFNAAISVDNEPVDIAHAASILNPRIPLLDSRFPDRTPSGAQVATRVVSQRTHLGRVPQYGQAPGAKNVWYFTGLASRGLVYHALLSEFLVNDIIKTLKE